MPDKTFTQADIDAKQVELNKATERAQKFEGQIAGLAKEVERFKGVDLEALRAGNEELAILKRDNAKNGDGKDLERWEKDKTTEIESRYAKDWQGKVTEKDKKIADLEKTNRTHNVTDKAWNEVSGKFTKDSPTLIKPYIEKYVDKNDDGEFIIKDENGNIRMQSGQPNIKMTLSDFATEIAGKHPSNAVGNATRGTRDQGQKLDGSVGGITLENYSKMTPDQKAQIPTPQRRKLAYANTTGRPIPAAKE